MAIYMVMAQLISFDLPVNQCNSNGELNILPINNLSDIFFCQFNE